MEAKTEQDQTAATSLDLKDFEILKALQENAKLTIREIAGLVHLSATPTHERIKRLERSGVIKQYAALLDHRRVNKGIMVFCQVSLKEHNKKIASEFIEAIMQFKEVIECYNISGDFDFMLKIVAQDMESHHNFFVNRLSEIKGIAQTNSIFVMGTIKQTHQLL